MSSPGSPATEPNKPPPTIKETAAQEIPDSGGLLTVAYAGHAGKVDKPALARQFGDYDLIQELGRGGMGVVYKARQKKLEPHRRPEDDPAGPVGPPDDLQRFRTEAEAAARLQHPNIVQVYEVGEARRPALLQHGLHRGPQPGPALAAGPLPAGQAARYVMLIARAMHHAHRHGILHRDLKPSNILLDADDQPHITDFGLAKRLGRRSAPDRRPARSWARPATWPPSRPPARSASSARPATSTAWGPCCTSC